MVLIINIEELKEMRAQGVLGNELSSHFKIKKSYIGFLVRKYNLPRMKGKKKSIYLKVKSKIKPSEITKFKKVVKPLPSIKLVADVPCFMCGVRIVHCTRTCESLNSFVSSIV